MSGDTPLAAPTMAAPLIAKLCRDRAAQYGALRTASPTAVALDQAASLIETALRTGEPLR